MRIFPAGSDERNREPDLCHRQNCRNRDRRGIDYSLRWRGTQRIMCQKRLSGRRLRRCREEDYVRVLPLFSLDASSDNLNKSSPGERIFKRKIDPAAKLTRQFLSSVIMIGIDRLTLRIVHTSNHSSSGFSGRTTLVNRLWVKVRVWGPACSLLFAVFSALPLSAAEDRAGTPYTAEERSHWSLQPRSRPTPPRFRDEADRTWAGTPLDAFVLGKLRERDLSPAPEADRRTLIRRLSFDLTGLPPSPQEIEDFVGDSSPHAYARLIERLLASPHYGERWGMHWLDTVRYAESEGFEYDRPQPNAWRYRDYVIQSFQNDKPYDQFIREQLAGDECESPTIEQMTAVGFLRVGPVRRNAGNAAVAFSRQEVLTEITDTLGVTLLGMTFGCARCHDHMFDAIRQKDYYSLQAFLAGTHEWDFPLAKPEEQADWQQRTEKLSAEIRQLEASLESAAVDARTQLQEQLKKAEANLPPPLPMVFTVRNDPGKRSPIHVLQRGREDLPGDAVGPRFPGVLLPDGTPEYAADIPRPRSRLAEWLVEPNHPLTARVMVNRIWLQHFGHGIVNTPNDFGVNGELPSHPELLDFLANEFVAGGWSVKSLHRLILNSNTYRQASVSPVESEAFPQDPQNRLLWKFPRRRLQAEEIRDAMLAVSNRLNVKQGGPSAVVPVDPDLVDLLYKPSQWTVTSDRNEHDRRSIYLMTKRNLRLPFLEVFDQPSAQTSCPKRESSTHAPQALELLNGRLSNELSRDLANRIEREAGSNRRRLVELAYLLLTGRLPTDAETRLADEFLNSQPLSEFTLAMFNLNDFLYVK